MTLIKWKPAFPDFSDMFDDFFGDDDFYRKWPARVLHMPAVNVRELDKSFVLEVAAPGFKKEDFEISVDSGMMTISAEVKAEKKKEEDNFTRKEFTYESFKRTFTLPDDVKSDNIKAMYEDGILKIELPKTKKASKEPSKIIEIG
jgi:HSP20 family protein